MSDEQRDPEDKQDDTALESTDKACPVCGGTSFESSMAPYALKVAGKIFTADLPASTCVGCAETQFEVEARDKFDVAVMQSLAQGVALPRAARFLRQTLLITEEDFARYCGVDVEAVLAWEKRGASVPQAAWKYLINLVPVGPEEAAEEPE